MVANTHRIDRSNLRTPIPRVAGGKAWTLAPKPVGQFPLIGRFTAIGLCSALVAGVLFQSMLASLAFLLVFVCGGAVWRKGESFLAYCLAFQWVEFVAGYFYECVTGDTPDPWTRGDLERAILYSLIGLVAVTVGLRMGIAFSRKWSGQRWHDIHNAAPYDISKLFYCSVAISLFNCFVSVTPMAIWFNAAQIITHLLRLTNLFLPLLLFAVIHTRRGYKYAIIATFLHWIPSLASHMSAFSGVFITLLIVLTSEWKPWERFTATRQHTSRIFWRAILTAASLIFLAIFWTGGMKGVWRPRILSGDVSGKPIAKAQEFMATAVKVLPEIDVGKAFRDLSARLASSTALFGKILNRVPAEVDHADGEITLRAIYHITHPRIFFPNKINLGSDSPMVIKYAGVAAAGMESNTSVGIGYMAEFYVDFGLPWMWIAVLAWGFIIGALYEGSVLFTRSYDMYRAVVIAILAGFSGSGGDIAKDLGGVLQGWIIFAMIFFFFGKSIDCWLKVKTGSSEKSGA